MLFVSLLNSHFNPNNLSSRISRAEASSASAQQNDAGDADQSEIITSLILLLFNKTYPHFD